MVPLFLEVTKHILLRETMILQLWLRRLRWVEREARGEEIGVTRMQVRVPRIHIGNNSAQKKAMRLANVQTFGSNVWRPNINLSARR